jgi:hypothetical protein
MPESGPSPHIYTCVPGVAGAVSVKPYTAAKLGSPILGGAGDCCSGNAVKVAECCGSGGVIGGSPFAKREKGDVCSTPATGRISTDSKNIFATVCINL